MARSHTNQETECVDIPVPALAEYARLQAMRDGEIFEYSPEYCTDLDTWTIIDEVELDDLEYIEKDGTLCVWGETTVTCSRRIARATHRQPAEYENVEHRCIVSITTDFPDTGERDVDVELDVIR